jgi:hypothetical protein
MLLLVTCDAAAGYRRMHVVDYVSQHRLDHMLVSTQTNRLHLPTGQATSQLTSHSRLLLLLLLLHLPQWLSNSHASSAAIEISVNCAI